MTSESECKTFCFGRLKPRKKTRKRKKVKTQKIEIYKKNQKLISFSFLRLAAKFDYCFFVSLFSLSPSLSVSDLSIGHLYIHIYTHSRYTYTVVFDGVAFAGYRAESDSAVDDWLHRS